MDEASNRTAGFSAGEKRVSAAQTGEHTAAQEKSRSGDSDTRTVNSSDKMQNKIFN
jgi:hypothetical protein